MLNRRIQQKGFTLIEIMIAMVVSLVLVAGVGTVYISSQRTYQTRDQLSAMEENARVALEALSKHLEHARYASEQQVYLDKYFYVNGDPTPTSVSCDTSSNIVDPTRLQGTRDRDGNTQLGDMVGVFFVGDNSIFSDCANAQLPAGCRVGAAASAEASRIYNTFYVANSSGVPNLMCAGSRNATAQPLAVGVENIQFLYGVDNDFDGSADRYLNATNVSAGGLWQQVVSIKVALLVRSQDTVYQQDTAQSFTLLDVAITRTDRYQRAVYTAVIYLRNVAAG